MVVVICLAAAAAFALFNRLRGGLWGDRIRAALGDGRLARLVWGTGGARLLSWGVPCGLLAAMVGAPWWHALAIGLLAFAGATTGQGAPLSFLGIKPKGDGDPGRVYRLLFDPTAAFSMGHDGGVTGFRCWWNMTWWGLLRAAPGAFMAFSGYAAAWLLPGALLCAPIYFIVWYAPEWLLFPGGGAGKGPGARDYPELAEWIVGGLMGAGLARAVLL